MRSARTHRKRRKGQQEVPRLQRRQAENSRKLLYFMKAAEECEMSAGLEGRGGGGIAGGRAGGRPGALKIRGACLMAAPYCAGRAVCCFTPLSCPLCLCGSARAATALFRAGMSHLSLKGSQVLRWNAGYFRVTVKEKKREGS